MAQRHYRRCKMVKITIIIEGGEPVKNLKRERDLRTTAMSPDGINLRSAWHKLLAVSEDGIKPRGSYKTSVTSYKRHLAASESSLLLVDSDGVDRIQWLKDKDLEEYSENVFFMVQQQEAWFLSQPKSIEAVYGNHKDIASNISLLLDKYAHCEAIKYPKSEFTNLLNRCFVKPKYNIKQQAELIEKLDIVLLRNTFSEVKNLLDRIDKIAKIAKIKELSN